MMKDIPGYPGYLAGDDGTIYTKKRRGFAAKNGPVYPPKVLIASSRSVASPYLSVSLHHEGAQVTEDVHVLVCRAFHGEPLDGQEVRHLNGDPHDNRAANLAWGTRSENQRDKLAHGTDMRGVKHTRAKLTEDLVREIRTSQEPGVQIAKRLDVSKALISAVRTRKAWSWLE